VPTVPAPPGQAPLPLPIADSPSQSPTAKVDQPVVPPAVGARAPEGDNLFSKFLRTPEGPDELGRLSGYRVLRILGQGGMGLIFEAEDIQLGRRVALKVIRPDQSDTDILRQRFLQEARAVARIEHDHIVTIYQVAEDNGVLFLAMQLLQGESLSERLKRESRLTLRDVLRIARQSAEGLAAAHERGLIHRDIKPANIFLERISGKPDPRVKILDFGLVRQVEGDNPVLTQTGFVVGTPGYMSPEQARSQQLDARSDLFSLGCVIHRMAAGEEPFKGESPLNVLVSLTVDPVRRLTEFRDDVPERLASLVHRLLAKLPNGRPKSAGVVGEELGAIEEQLGYARPRTPWPAQPPSAPPVEKPKPAPSAPVAPADPPSQADWKSLSTLPRPKLPGDKPADPPPIPAVLSGPVKAPGEADAAPDPAATVCPKCKKEFWVVEGLRWCLRCGYCYDTNAPIPADQAAKTADAADQHWGFMLAAGALLIVTVTLFGGTVPSNDPELLVWWVRVQFGLGLVSCCAGYVWLVLLAARERKEDRLAHFLNPVLLVRQVFEYLPQTRSTLYAVGWGITAMVGAVALYFWK
jgi:serine/threonine protein kinase